MTEKTDKHGDYGCPDCEKRFAAWRAWKAHRKNAH
jgi:hypothetical protein